MDDLAPGTLVDGRYRIEALLGRGGMGVVLRAREAAADRAVALKVLSIAAADLVDLARFEREARLAARIDHPGVVRVHAFGRHAGRPYVAMDLAPGRHLGALIAAGPPPARRLAAILERAARAVAACHAAGVLHRDLKPENVLVDEAAGDAVKVIDFGLARDCRDRDRLTRSGEVLGTPAYLAPEQALGGGVDARTDVYGLGATLWAGLAGRPPFDGPVLEVLEAVVTRGLPPASTVRPGADPDLEAVARRATARDPAARYPDAEALADDLARVARGAPPRGGRGRPRRAALGLALGLALAAGAALAARARAAARAAADRAEVEAALEWDGLACARGERPCRGGAHRLAAFGLGLAGAPPLDGAELAARAERLAAADLALAAARDPAADLALAAEARLLAHRWLLAPAGAPRPPGLPPGEPSAGLVEALRLLPGAPAEAAHLASDALGRRGAPPDGWRVRAAALARLFDGAPAAQGAPAAEGPPPAEAARLRAWVEAAGREERAALREAGARWAAAAFGPALEAALRGAPAPVLDIAAVAAALGVTPALEGAKGVALVRAEPERLARGAPATAEAAHAHAARLAAAVRAGPPLPAAERALLEAVATQALARAETPVAVAAACRLELVLRQGDPGLPSPEALGPAVARAIGRSAGGVDAAPLDVVLATYRHDLATFGLVQDDHLAARLAALRAELDHLAGRLPGSQTLAWARLQRDGVPELPAERVAAYLAALRAPVPDASARVQASGWRRAAEAAVQLLAATPPPPDPSALEAVVAEAVERGLGVLAARPDALRHRTHDARGLFGAAAAAAARKGDGSAAALAAIDGARAWFQRALPDLAAQETAVVALQLSQAVLSAQTATPALRARLEAALVEGSPGIEEAYRPQAAVTLARLRRERGDLAGARAAFAHLAPDELRRPRVVEARVQVALAAADRAEARRLAAEARGYVDGLGDLRRPEPAELAALARLEALLEDGAAGAAEAPPPPGADGPR